MPDEHEDSTPEHIGKTMIPPYQQAERLERGCGLEFLKHSKIRG
jgi:hypothetical protein